MFWRNHWIFRFHPVPKPLTGWGFTVHQSSLLINKTTESQRVELISFGEGAQHVHLHLFPGFVSQSETKKCVSLTCTDRWNSKRLISAGNKFMQFIE